MYDFKIEAADKPALYAELTEAAVALTAGEPDPTGFDIVVNATSVIQVTTQVPAVLSDSGNANPDLNFRYAAGTTGAYIFNLST